MCERLRGHSYVKLNKKGFDVGTREDELAEVRQKELEKLTSGDNDKARALQMLQSLLEEAVAGGANSIELEYVDEGLEITHVSWEQRDR